MNEQELLDAVGRLPKSLEPPRDLWPGISTRINARLWRRWYWVPLAAAAALALVLIGAWSNPTAGDAPALAGRPPIGTKPLPPSGRRRAGACWQPAAARRA